MGLRMVASDRCRCPGRTCCCIDRDVVPSRLLASSRFRFIVSTWRPCKAAEGVDAVTHSCQRDSSACKTSLARAALTCAFVSAKSCRMCE
jgi:hypothetical protein